MSQRLGPLRLLQAARPASFQQINQSSRMMFTTTQYSSPSQLLRQVNSGFRMASRQTTETSPKDGAKDSAKEGTKEGAKAEAGPQTLGARLKKLTKEYGWVTVAVYFGLSVLDFPFCFLIVKVVGPEKIGEIEHHVIEYTSHVVPEPVKTAFNSSREWAKEAWASFRGQAGDSAGKGDWGVKSAQDAHQVQASLATQLALAYAIHKSFIFLRVPLTAAVTPKVVKILRGWGWQIGKKKSKS
ncbi:unnamed protein product [Parascedosporium putredinis]|uniref:DUF1279 domain-containing protein n=1 Tax=Parascedosporium putredinis TaxID=1442378 RepID=A0A9P1GYG4_9PEZI|nr:unnamed protein product [Parascedosporium putredinis]CAI7989934.1 unnamed protein product [Parascedosporium putredinis]